MPNRHDLKEFGSLLSRDERFLWDKLNAGFSPKEIIEKFKIPESTFHYRWKLILNKGKRFFK